MHFILHLSTHDILHLFKSNIYLAHYSHHCCHFIYVYRTVNKVIVLVTMCERQSPMSIRLAIGTCQLIDFVMHKWDDK